MTLPAPTCVATISGIKNVPAGSHVTFTGRILRCARVKGRPAAFLADESGLIRVEGPGVERWKKGENFRIEHGILQKEPTSSPSVRIDSETVIVFLKEPVFVEPKLLVASKSLLK